MSLPESHAELEDRQRRLLRERRLAKETLATVENQGRQIGYILMT